MKTIMIKIMLFVFMVPVSHLAIAQDYETTIATCTSSLNTQTGTVTVTCTPTYSDPFQDWVTNDLIGGIGKCIPPTKWWVSSSNPVSAQVGQPITISVWGGGGVVCGGPLQINLRDIETWDSYCWAINNNSIGNGFVPSVNCTFTLNEPGVYNIELTSNAGGHDAGASMKWSVTVTP